MAIDKETIIKQLQKMATNAKGPECPAILPEERLEYTFKNTQA